MSTNYVIEFSEKEIVQVHMAIQDRITTLKRRLNAVGPDAFEQTSIEMLIQVSEKLMSAQKGASSDDS